MFYDLWPMPRIRETLLQVKERQRRELRLRIESRCVQLVAQGQFRVTGRDNLQEITDEEDNPNIEQHGNDPQLLKAWIPCINVTSGLLLLIAANCLILQYIFLYKAKSV
jgi:hypothetical protein